jgi:hypothetical protein
MLKNLPIILLGIVLIAVVGVSCYTDPRYQGKQNGAEDNAPRMALSQSDTPHSGQEAAAPKHTPIWRILLAWPEGVTALAVLFTLFFIAWQAILMRQTVTASEDVSKRELRACLTVVIGSGCYQQRRPVEDGGDLRFDSSPQIVNNGQTPARKVTYKARAAIVQIAAIPTIHLPEDPDENSGGSILGPGQTATAYALVEGFCAEDEVEKIKYSTGDRCFLVWGKITYEDVFGERHFTRFCQAIYWDMKDNVRGRYIPGRNDAD